MSEKMKTVLDKKNKNNKAGVEEGLILAWGEIFLKSAGVQKDLKNKLVKNFSSFLKKEGIGFEIDIWRERIFVRANNLKKAACLAKNTFGLVWFAKSFFLEGTSLDELSSFVDKNYKDWIKEKESFALRVKKSPDVSYKRDEIIDKAAEKIKRKVNLDKPNKEIFIEARKKGWFVYFQKEKGLGGLPVGSQGSVLTLISGGIDSPVASFLMAKRGARNIWLHFHSFPLVSRSSIEKVKDLANVFLKYQPNLKVYFIPFSKIQSVIKTTIPAKYRVLFYRRIMLETAQKIAKREKYQALTTGESLGQVSSQTLPNLKIAQENIELPILRPLIGMDKEEIIKLSKKTSLYNVSVIPQEDCCTLFVPKGQTALAKAEVFEQLEKNLKIKGLVSEAIRKVEIELFN